MLFETSCLKYFGIAFILFSVILSFNLLIVISFSFGQTSDSLLLKKSSLELFSSGPNVFDYQDGLRIGVATLMISYGVAAIENDQLKSFNLSIKNEVTEDHPHFNFRLDDYLQNAPAVAVYALNLAGIHGDNKFIDRTIILGITLGIEGIAVGNIKTWSHVQRPDGGDYRSFPSGHTATAFATAEFLRQEYKDVSPWICIAGYTAALVTGGLRIYNNQHWFSDVVAGAGIGIISTDIAYMVYPVIKRKLLIPVKSAAMVIPYFNTTDNGIIMVLSF